LLREALAIDPTYAPALRSLAWILAVSPSEKLRDGETAVRLARNAIEITGGESPSLLSTLAAAQAEIGDFDAAIETSERALALASKVGAPTQVIADALEHYRAGRPYRLR
jgi:tetratricopeptide (TPR) repeat protein